MNSQVEVRLIKTTLYEMMDPNEGTPSSLVENQEEILETPRDSGSDLQSSGSALLEEDSQQPQPRRSKRGSVLHKMMKSLEQYNKLSYLLLVING
jgi:hypothetical protein